MRYFCGLAIAIGFVGGIVPADPARSEERAVENRVGRTEAEIQLFLETELVPLDRIHPTEVKAFIEELSAQSGLKFLFAEEVEGRIPIDGDKKLTYLGFLDDTLSAIGVTWRRQPGTSVIWITKGFSTQRFSLTIPQLRHLEALTRSEDRKGKDKTDVLRRRILGASDSRSAVTNPSRIRIEGSELVVTDSDSNIRKVKAYLDRQNPVTVNPSPGPFPPRTGSIHSMEHSSAGVHSKGSRADSYGRVRFYEPRHRTTEDLRSAVQGIVWYTIP